MDDILHAIASELSREIKIPGVSVHGAPVSHGSSSGISFYPAIILSARPPGVDKDYPWLRIILEEDTFVVEYVFGTMMEQYYDGKEQIRAALERTNRFLMADPDSVSHVHAEIARRIPKWLRRQANKIVQRRRNRHGVTKRTVR